MNAKKMLARYAQGGMVDESVDVSKARQMLQNLTSPVQRFADGGQVVPPGWRVSLITGELVPVNATVAQLTEIFKGGEAQQANAAAAAQAVATAPAVSAPPVQASPAVSAPPAPAPAPAPVQDIISSYSSYSPPSEPAVSAPPTPVQASPVVSAPVASPPSSDLSEGLRFVQQHPEIFGAGQAGVDKYYQNIRDYVTGANRSAAEVRAEMEKYGVSDKDMRDALAGTQSSNLSEGLQFVQQHPDVFGSGQAGVDKYYQNIRDFVDTKGADLSAAQVLAEMNKYGVSEKDIRDALAGTDYSAGAVYALSHANIGARGSPGYGVGGLSGMSANIRAKVDDLTQQAQKGLLSQEQAADFFTTHLSPTSGFNEADFIRATGKTSAQLLAQMRPIVLPIPTPLPDGTTPYVPPTAPAPVPPPAALTPGQKGLDVGTAIGGKIPQEERVATPQLETAFRSSSPRDPIYDRFGRITGYNYSSAAKLTPATGTDVFNFVPPGVISRPRSLIEVGKVPGITFDPVTGQIRLPLSASQQFARDRSEIDNKLRAYLQTSAAADSALPSQPPSAASTAFRNYVLSDPQLSTQLRMRNIAQTPLQQQEYMPGGGESPNMQAIRQARSEFGETPYASAMEQGLQTFLNRNRQALIDSKLMQKSYFERYPQVAEEYQRNWSKSMGPEEYALYHYRTLGQKEGKLPPNFVAQQFFSKGGEASTEDFIKKQVGGDVSRETTSPNTAEVPSVDAEGRLIDENAEMRSEAQRMLNRLKTAQQASYRRGKLPPGVQRVVTDVMSEEKPPLIRGKAIQTAGDIVGGLVSATPREPTNPSEAYRLMQGFTGAYLPTAPVVRTAQAVKTAAQEPRATMSAAGRSARESLEALGDIPVAMTQPNQLGSQAGAVRPYGKGTVFSGVKLANDRYVGSSLDDYIDQGKSAAFRTSDVVKADAIQKFFDTKARRYMSTQLGTERDPVFDAIKKGRISNLALHDIQGLRKYAIEAAGEGKYKVDKETGKNVLDQYGRPIFYPKDPQAVMDVTKAYDEMVNVRPMSFKPGLIPQTYKTSDPAYVQEAERVREQMRQAFEAEGLDPRLVNLKSEPMILTSARDTGEPYYPGYLYRMDDFIKDKLSGNPEAMKGVPENIRRALDQEELLYDVGLNRGPLEDILDPENMVNYLATLSPKEIDKIRFEDAVVGSAKFNRETIDRKFEGLRLQELVKSGKAPDKVFSKGVSEPLLQFGEDQRYPGFAWKRIEDLEATIPEGAYVGHSVGGYALGGTGYGPSFTKGFQEGTHEIYSLRDARNRPVTTIQVIDYGDKSNPYRVVKQIRGNGAKTGNTAPVDYDVEVYDFLTQVVKPDAITESDSYLTPMLIQYRDAIEANRQTR